MTPDAAMRLKQAAAIKAVELVRSGMKIGLGTGSTANFATRRIAELLHAGELRDIVAFATSKATDAEARHLGIPMLPDDLPQDLDVTIDGADEVDPELDLIKGGGGALLREKIVAQVSRREIIVVDDTKPSPRLGTRWPVPVEVLPFGWRSQARFLESLGATVVVRNDRDGNPFVTDSGNMILDGRFGPIADAPALATVLGARAGIVEHGLFIGLADDLIVAGAQGIEHRTRPSPRRLPHILFVCVENSGRSQMAEGFARARGGERIAAYSAGSRPSGRVNPRAIALMQEQGIDLTQQESKGFDDLPTGVRWDVVVTMGCGDACPHLPAASRLDWDVPDPKSLSDDELRIVRDRIASLVGDLLDRVASRDHAS